MLVLGLFHGRRIAGRTGRRALRLTREGVTIGGRFFTRFTAIWADIDRVDIDATRASRYYELFRAQAGSWKTETTENAGAGGSSRRDVYLQPRLVMEMGTRTVTLKDVPIFPTRMNAAIDVLFGNLGQDFVDGFESFSLDFSMMTFSAGVSRGVR